MVCTYSLCFFSFSLIILRFIRVMYIIGIFHFIARVYYDLFSHSPSDNTHLAMTDKTAVNIGIQIFVWIYAFCFLEQIPRSRMAGL